MVSSLGERVDVKESVRQQFGRVASNYATSAVHVSGPDLLAMLDAVELTGNEVVLDVGTGTGHTAIAFAPRVETLTAVDVTEQMLAQGRRLADERGLYNLTFQVADAESLPFPDQHFDLVTSRYCAHHFARPSKAVHEIARVLKPNGTFLLVDVISPEDPATDTFLNAVEVLRDTSHVRDYRVAEWESMLAGAGLAYEHLGEWPLRLELDLWTTRMETPPETVAEIRRLMRVAPAHVRTALAVEGDMDVFSIPVVLFRGKHM